MSLSAVLLALPILIPMLAGLTALVRNRELRRRLTLIGFTVNLGVVFVILYSVFTNGLLVSQMGGHAAPYGITLVADPLSAVMLVITGFVSLCAAMFAVGSIDARRDRFSFFPLLALLLMGVNWAFLTGDLFTLYVAFEVMLMSSFVLITLGGERGQIEGGLKYVTLNLLSSTIFLIAAGLTYDVVGTLNMAQLVQRIAARPDPDITTVLAGLFLIAFGIKSAIFPLYAWLPSSYHTPPPAISALFGGLLTKVGIYAMLRVLVMIFPRDMVFLQPLLFSIAGLTMITGVLGAIAQSDFRRLLSFLIVGEIGFLLMGIGLMTIDGLASSILFMVHVIAVKTLLFFVSGIVGRLNGTYDIRQLGQMVKTHPYLAAAFLIAAFSLAGLPPFSGFWAKFLLIRAGLASGQYGITFIALFVSLLILYEMIKLWHEVFWKKLKEPLPATEPLTSKDKPWLYLPITALLLATILAGLVIEPFYQASIRAADGVLHTQPYVQQILPATKEAP